DVEHSCLACRIACRAVRRLGACRTSGRYLGTGVACPFGGGANLVDDAVYGLFVAAYRRHAGGDVAWLAVRRRSRFGHGDRAVGVFITGPHVQALCDCQPGGAKARSRTAVCLVVWLWYRTYCRDDGVDLLFPVD